MIGPSEARYVARVSPAESDQLRELHRAAPRVHKSLSANHPRRRKSRELSELLTRLHRRGVPIDVLADIVGISHQAIRSRVNATDLPHSLYEELVRTVNHDESEGGVFISDAGMHRRLMIYRNPTAVPHLRMLSGLPFLETREQAVAWLESFSEQKIGSSPSATPLRTPPAVYFAQDLAHELLVPLTPEADS